ncbi:crosslink repair DNA glycosylase YcaQ family protein [Asanoa sp. NPDC049573]|uniref:DNA glycosylase AlkZ-like family protein n=1 Tax=Asanoa sp. NPDC049573 TaxID=3155396 RepID=UPI003420899B
MADAQLSTAAVAAHRVAVHGGGGVLEVGIQDTPPGTSAHQALAVRGVVVADDGLAHGARGAVVAGDGLAHGARGAVVAGDGLADGARGAMAGDGLALVHGARGAMHLHWAADLPALAAALRPDEQGDLRKQAFGPFFAGLSGSVGAALDEVAGAMAAVMGDGVRRSKGELSSALRGTVDARLRPFCERCGADHVADALFRLASLPAGLRLLPNGDGSADFVSGPLLGGLPDVDAARRELVRRFLRYAGPTDRDGLAGWLGLSPSAARRWWALAEVVPVSVAGRRLYLHPDDLAAARTAPGPRAVWLLPPNDPVLELGDRTLLVPEAADRKRVWRPTANPGVLLVDGIVAGIWRRRAGTVTVTPFGSLSPAGRRRLAAVTEGEVVVAES